MKGRFKINKEEIKSIWTEIKPIIICGVIYTFNYSFTSLTFFVAHRETKVASGNLERLFYLCLLDYLFIVLYDNM